MKSLIKRSSSWPVSSADKAEITNNSSQGSTNKQPQPSYSFSDTDAGSSRRSNFESLCSLISEELKYLNKDPEVLKKYGEAVLKQLNEAQAELQKLTELIKDMPESTPDDDPHFKTLRDELQKLKKRVTKLKGKFPSKVKIHLLENEADKTPSELKRDSQILTLLTEQKLNLPTLYGDSVFEQSEIFGNFYSLYNDLGDSLKKKLCLLCFSVFPKDAKIRRRVMIYWWMAEGFIDKKIDGTSFLETFSKMGFIIPISSKPRSHIHSYKLHPLARVVLMYLAQRACLFDFNTKDGTPTEKYSSSLQAFLVGQGLSDARNLERLHMIFNLNESTLEFNPEWFPRMKNINVLLLGRWQSDETHHVEIENPEFLEHLKHLQFLKFLSLQGVSRVTELPNSIMKLESLKILDLRACHNLEVIPAGIGCLKNLTHLDMSDCYLIDHMPKEISGLENLKVLMGFVVGDPKENRMKRKSPCTLKDLGRLKKLEKLGIYMSVANFETEDLKALQGFVSLKTLSISWGSASKDRLASSGEKTKGKTPQKADNGALKKKTEAMEKKRKEAPEKKKTGKRVRIKDVADESAKFTDQASPQITTKQERSEVPKDGAEESTGATEKTISPKVIYRVETSPEATQQASPRTTKDEADKSIGTIEEESPRATKDAVHKSTEATEHANPQANNEQESPVTAKDVTEKSTASTEEPSPLKVKDAADAEKPSSETNQQASPEIRKDQADNSIGTTEQTINKEIKKATDSSSGTVQHTSPQIEKYAAEISPEATDQISAQTTNEEAVHQTLKDIIDQSTAIIEQASPQKGKKEEDLIGQATEQKPQAPKDSADANEQKTAEAHNTADIPENITNKKDQENEKIDPKTTLLAPVGSPAKEKEGGSSKTVDNNTSVRDTKKTHSEVEGQGKGTVEDKQSLSTPVVASNREAEGEISRAVDHNKGISEDSKKKMNQENEGDGEDNAEDKKDSLDPTTADKKNEVNTEKVTEDKNHETKQGNNSPGLRTISKLPKGRGLNRSQTILGAIGNVFHSGEQGSANGSSYLTLPKSLEKLQLVCYPEINSPNWLKPESLQSLKKLYISGGKLHDLGKIYDWNDGKPCFTKNTWKVDTLRLKYLSHMEMKWKELRHLFPQLINLETVSCPKLTLFPCDGDGMWIDKTKTITQPPQ